MPQTLDPAGGICLSDVLPQSRVVGGSNVLVRSVCADYRQCRPGDLYVALLQQDEDGHDFAEQAVARGAVAVLAERLLPLSVPVCLVRDTRIAFGQICQRLAGSPAEQMRMVGVSGTNGKTVTTWLTQSVLGTVADVGRTSDISHFDGVEQEASSGITPTAPELAHWLARMVSNHCTGAVVELSSQALASHRAAAVPLDVAVLTNLRKDHLDLHGSVSRYRKIKRRLFDLLKPDGVAVLNADDPASQRLLAQVEHPTLTYALRGDADITATLLERHPSEQTFLLHAGQETVPVRTRIIGDHHISNCLAAAAVGLVHRVDLTDIVRGLESLDRIPGRLERLECGQPFSVYVDVAKTPDTLAVALHSIRQAVPGRVFCLYGAEANDAAEVRAHLGRVVERSADVEVITSNNPRDEEPLQIAHDILDGYERPGRPHVLPDRSKAIEYVLGAARSGDGVLIAGKGDRCTQWLGSRQLPFDDRLIARHFLYQQAQAGPSPCSVTS